MKNLKFCQILSPSLCGSVQNHVKYNYRLEDTLGMDQQINQTSNYMRHDCILLRYNLIRIELTKFNKCLVDIVMHVTWACQMSLLALSRKAVENFFIDCSP